MRKSWIIAAGIALIVTLVPGAASASAATCPKGHVCVWVEYEWKGAEGESLCTGGAHPLAGQKKSGIDSCANKAVWFRENGESEVCLNPGGEDASFWPFTINELWIGAEGSHC